MYILQFLRYNNQIFIYVYLTAFRWHSAAVFIFVLRVRKIYLHMINYKRLEINSDWNRDTCWHFWELLVTVVQSAEVKGHSADAAMILWSSLKLLLQRPGGHTLCYFLVVIDTDITFSWPIALKILATRICVSPGPSWLINSCASFTLSPS